MLEDLKVESAACVLEFIQLRSCKNIANLLLHFRNQEGSVFPHFIHELGTICQILKVYINNLRDGKLQKEFAALGIKMKDRDRDEFKRVFRGILEKKGLITSMVEDVEEFARQMLENIDEFKTNPKFKEFLESSVDTLFDDG